MIEAHIVGAVVVEEIGDVVPNNEPFKIKWNSKASEVEDEAIGEAVTCSTHLLNRYTMRALKLNVLVVFTSRCKSSSVASSSTSEALELHLIFERFVIGDHFPYHYHDHDLYYVSLDHLELALTLMLVPKLWN